MFRVSYFLTVNATDVESLTSSHLTFDAIQKALETVTATDGTKLVPVEVAEDRIINVNSLFKLIVDKPVKIVHIKKIEFALLTILQISSPGNIGSYINLK